MTYTLDNEQFHIQVKPEGAELCSARSKTNNKEYIWQADPAVWARHAPVLFPIVGRLKNDQYQYDGQSYTMSQHGFARDQTFQCIQQEDAQLSFELTASEETRKKYPFNFRLVIRYQLSGSRLAVVYEVKNNDKKPMPFSIGGHPAFYCPAQLNKQWQEYQLLFEKNETLERHLLKDGLRTGETKPLVDQEHILPLHRHLFEDDAIVFYQVQSDKMDIIEQGNGKKMVTMHAKGFPYLGIWQKLGADFFCIEPWYGVTDAEDTSGDIMQKEGIQLLEPGETFTAAYSMEFHA